jgi:hypothetical protein
LKRLFSCQLIILLTYFLSGIWKIEAGLGQLFDGQIGSFHPQAMAYQIAGKLAETNEHGERQQDAAQQEAALDTGTCCGMGTRVASHGVHTVTMPGLAGCPFQIQTMSISDNL